MTTPVTYDQPDGSPDPILIAFPDAEDMPESLLLTPLGENRWRLDETPVFSEAAALGDTIEAHGATDGTLRFVRVLERSGLRTVRQLVHEGFLESDAWRALEAWLETVGGQWELAFGGFLMLHVPAERLDELEARMRDVPVQTDADPGSSR